MFFLKRDIPFESRPVFGRVSLPNETNKKSQRLFFLRKKHDKKGVGDGVGGVVKIYASLLEESDIRQEKNGVGVRQTDSFL